MNKGDTEPPRRAPSGQLKQKRGRQNGWSLDGRNVGYTRWIGHLLFLMGIGMGVFFWGLSKLSGQKE